MSGRRSVRSTKYPVDEISVDEMSIGEMSGGRNVRDEMTVDEVSAIQILHTGNIFVL